MGCLRLTLRKLDSIAELECASAVDHPGARSAAANTAATEQDRSRLATVAAALAPQAVGRVYARRRSNRTLSAGMHAGMPMAWMCDYTVRS